MSDISLLPINATETERALSSTVARLSDVPLMVRTSLDPNTCPAELLPWLAWAYSVDEWQEVWTEQDQRNVIKNSLFIHKHKGTLAALRRAVEPLGYIIRIVEWYEDSPVGLPYTFRIDLGVNEKPIDEAMYSNLETLIETYKNVRSHMVNLTIKADIVGKLYAGSGLMSGVATDVYPYDPGELESICAAIYAAFEQSVDTVEIYPA